MAETKDDGRKISAQIYTVLYDARKGSQRLDGIKLSSIGTEAAVDGKLSTNQCAIDCKSVQKESTRFRGIDQIRKQIFCVCCKRPYDRRAWLVQGHQQLLSAVTGKEKDKHTVLVPVGINTQQNMFLNASFL